jgi:hypothetical protein
MSPRAQLQLLVTRSRKQLLLLCKYKSARMAQTRLLEPQNSIFFAALKENEKSINAHVGL